MADDGGNGGGGDDATVSHIIKLVAWMFLPRIVAEFLLARYYDWQHRRRAPPAAPRPRPGTATYQRHFTRVYVALVLAYLAYSLAEVYYELPANYYDLFGLTPRNFELRAMKRQWRAISLEHHPDKNLGAENAAGLETFMQYRRAVEVLQNPLHRWAYGKFGRGVFEDCAHCLNEGEFVHAGLPGTFGYYIGTGVVLLLLSTFTKASSGRFWRWVGFAALAVTELNFVLRQDDILPWLYPSRTASEKIAILHQLYWAFTVGLSQIHPYVVAPTTHTDAQLLELVQELGDINEQAVAESTAEYAHVFRSFADDASRERLQRQIEKAAVETMLLRNPELAAARRAALIRRRP